MATTITPECTITNYAGHNLVLSLSNYETAAETIKNAETTTFTLTMPAIYMNGALVYEVGSSLRWVIFWTTDNQVSTKMFKSNDPLDLEQVGNNLIYHHRAKMGLFLAIFNTLHGQLLNHNQILMVNN
ncbi:ATPase synthesis 25, mitochondrial [Gossypium australe]|uniref:ATPase synthesis 25, mitochondrial n=1 Tax=Gossypium australe TaxID=47621 RepID=A0A5B6U8K2_9ROSI|nr:ATPase synthesis 25, mitochondrial [Gossypium australe]